MEFGLYLNQYGDERNDFDFEDMFEQLDVLEEQPYDVAAVGQRHFYEEGFYDPFTCLTAMATHTDSLKILANILILPVFHPIHLAERMMGLDHLTDGNAAFGVSLGYRESELENFGVPMDDRVSRFMEGLAITKRLLEGERFDYDGEHFSFEDAFVRPEPIQDPRPPILGGGSAEVAIKRAAYRCDGFTAAITEPEQLEADINRYYDALEEAGKDSEDGHVTIMVDGYVAESTEAAVDALDPYLIDLQTKYIKWGNPEFEGRPDWEDIEDQLLFGTPEEVAEKVELYRDIGVDRLIFRTQFPGMDQDVALRSIERFGDDVISQVR
ncbi:LLM class flavin-dependent oxidoreductase [Natronococcus pandeyae]|nr:LLM class flavin-dependent oxidoreductase [Natronococcus pandeyae]